MIYLSYFDFLSSSGNLYPHHIFSVFHLLPLLTTLKHPLSYSSVIPMLFICQCISMLIYFISVFVLWLWSWWYSFYSMNLLRGVLTTMYGRKYGISRSALSLCLENRIGRPSFLKLWWGWPSSIVIAWLSAFHYQVRLLSKHLCISKRYVFLFKFRN